VPAQLTGSSEVGGRQGTRGQGDYLETDSTKWATQTPSGVQTHLLARLHFHSLQWMNFRILVVELVLFLCRCLILICLLRSAWLFCTGFIHSAEEWRREASQTVRMIVVVRKTDVYAHRVTAITLIHTHANHL